MALGAARFETYIGARIAKRRRLINLSIQQLAGRLGIDPALLWSYEQGQLRISPALLVDVAEALQTPISFFLMIPALSATGRHGHEAARAAPRYRC